MTFIEILKKALDKTEDGGFYFQLVLLGVEKSCKKKVATMKLQINDEVAQNIFDNLNEDVRFGICIPRKVWSEAVEEYKKEKEVHDD